MFSLNRLTTCLATTSCVALLALTSGCDDNAAETAAGDKAVPVAGNRDMESTEKELGLDENPITIERIYPEQFYADAPLDYQIKLTNSSDQELQGVVVNHMMTGSVTLPDSQSKATEGKPTSAQQYEVGMMKPGDTKTITIKGQAGSQGTINSCVWVDYVAAQCQSFTVVDPEVKLEQMIVNAEGQQVGQVYACDSAVLKYRISNSGTGEIPASTLRVTLPDGVKTEKGQGSFTVDLDAIPAGETLEVGTVDLVIEGFTGEITADAMVDAGIAGQAKDSDTLTVSKPTLELAVEGPSSIYIGRTATMNVTVSNPSDVAALDTVVTLPMPDDVDRVSVSTGGVERDGNEFMIGTLDAGATKTFAVSFEANEPVNFSDTAVANAYCAAAVEQAVALNVEGVSAMQLEVIDGNDPIEVGAETTYEIRVSNEGNAKSLNVQINAQLPEGFSFVAAEPEGSVQANGRTLTFSPIPEIDPNDALDFVIRVRADQANRNGKFRLELNADDFKKSIRESESTTAF